MMKYFLTFALLVLAYGANAATTISTTLTMTSPSAIISMTGVNSTAYLRTVSSTNVSTTNLTLGTIPVVSATLVRAWATFSGTVNGSFTPSATYNLSTFSRIGTGTYQFAIAPGVFNNNASCFGTGTDGTNSVPMAQRNICSTTSCTVVANTSGSGAVNLNIATISCIGN